MAVERLEELVVLMELELLFHSIRIIEIIKSWDGLSIQDYKYFVVVRQLLLWLP